jgi:carbamoyltransferase
MIICGIKLTHDGGVSLVDNNRLVFSIELEKLGNNVRHQDLYDFTVINDLLQEYGLTPDDIDHFIIDGWRGESGISRDWGGQRVTLELAPYRRGIMRDDLLQPYRSRVYDLQYTSYCHYAGHVAAGYCSSSFARASEPAYVLCWDGAMVPFLYHYDPVAGRMTSLGALFYMLGDTYHHLAQLYPPFDVPVGWPQELDLPGKIMAYVAQGEPDERALQVLKRLHREAIAEEFSTMPPPDRKMTESTGRRILTYMRQRLSVPNVSADDMLASIHAFVGRTLVSCLVERIERDGHRTGNLCYVGGCALNIKWNRKIRTSGIAEEIWIPPFPNDSGSALGTACVHLLRTGKVKHLDWNPYSGPDLVSSTIPANWAVRPYSIADLARRLHRTGDPVMFLSGRAELGPRALGHRSILAPAVDPAMKHRLNQIKGREDYRPVAPICLQHRAPEVFIPGTLDPYMLFDHDVRPSWRDRVPAICHLDGTARIQTVGPNDDAMMFELLVEYERHSRIPVLCNTSANRSGSGFFPDLASAMRWGRIDAVWSEGKLYERG